MGVGVHSIRCPECGANLPVEEGRTQIFCSYCGTKVLITNDNEHIYRHIDEAGIKQAETERIVRMRELEMEAQRERQRSELKKNLIIIWIAISLITIVISMVLMMINDSAVGYILLMYVGIPIIVGGAYVLFKLIPEKENDRVLMSNGAIKLPKDISSYSEKSYEAVQASLEHAGFRNITCVNMHDLRIGLLQKPGLVDSITVNGEKISKGGRYYMPDVPITITYHGK